MKTKAHKNLNTFSELISTHKFDSFPITNSGLQCTLCKECNIFPWKICFLGLICTNSVTSWNLCKIMFTGLLWVDKFGGRHLWTFPCAYFLDSFKKDWCWLPVYVTFQENTSKFQHINFPRNFEEVDICMNHHLIQRKSKKET